MKNLDDTQKAAISSLSLFFLNSPGEAEIGRKIIAACDELEDPENTQEAKLIANIESNVKTFLSRRPQQKKELNHKVENLKKFLPTTPGNRI